MAFILALNGKGFAEFGTQGLRAATVVKQQRHSSDQEEIDRQIFKKLRSHDQRLAKLESRR